MLAVLMRPRGSFKIANRGTLLEAILDPLSRSELRAQRIVESLREQIAGGSPGQSLRIRQVFRTPREIYRLELELPELGFQRTTLLDRDALEELLASEGVRELVDTSPLEG
jgi:hypothetical protein